MCGTVGSTIMQSFTTVPIPDGELSTARAFKWKTEDYTLETPYLPPLYTKANWGDQYDD